MIAMLVVLLVSGATAAAQPAAPDVQELMGKATAGDPDAQFWLGAAYDYGRGVPRNGPEAEKWYRRAAESGHVQAQNSLGSVLQAARRYAEAREWYERAATQGHAVATNSLAYLYDLGLGVPQDRRRAFALYTRAADLGWPGAMWNLAAMYDAGQVGPKDVGMTCVWVLRARRFANPDQREVLVQTARVLPQLERVLSRAELARCRDQAEAWTPQGRPPGATVPPAAALPEMPLPPARLTLRGFSLVPLNERGWRVLERGPDQVILGKGGDHPDETFVIRAFPLLLPGFTSREAFLAETQTPRKEVAGAGRFTALSHTADPAPAQGEFCARTHTVFEDQGPNEQAGRSKVMLMEVYMLFCAHPKDKTLGIMVGYSQRYYPGQRDALSGEKSATLLDSVEFTDP